MTPYWLLIAVLQSTIVGRNTAPTTGPDLYTPVAEVFNIEFCLIGNTAGANITHTIPGSNVLNTDPKLAPLAKNGGPTRTHALKAGSPAINKGSNPALLATDQRGGNFLRVFGAFADIGAFEKQ